MKHSYTVGCECGRCTRELARRNAQSTINYGRQLSNSIRHNRRTHKTQLRSPIVGSAEWAETRGDDLGASPDY